MDSHEQAAAARAVLLRLADYLVTQQHAVTDQWLLKVRRDPQIHGAHQPTHQRLLDHLPVLFDELRSFLGRRGAADLPDANEQDGYRWQNGCAIDELLRELDVLRHLLATVIDRFHGVDDQFKKPADSMAEALVHQFFSEVTVHSVRQFLGANMDLQRALPERQELIAEVTHTLRNFLQGLAYAAKVWNAHGGSAELAHAQAQMQYIHELLQQLPDAATTTRKK